MSESTMQIVVPVLVLGLLGGAFLLAVLIALAGPEDE